VDSRCAIKAAWVDECGADSDVRRRIGRRVLFFARAPDVEHISTMEGQRAPCAGASDDVPHAESPDAR